MASWRRFGNLPPADFLAVCLVRAISILALRSEFLEKWCVALLSHALVCENNESCRSSLSYVPAQLGKQETSVPWQETSVPWQELSCRRALHIEGTSGNAE